MTKMVAGAFDDFASAQAAAEDLRGSGIGDGNVQITNNSKNPDGEPGTSLADEAATVPGILERVASSLFNVSELDPVEGRPVDEIRVGGIVVSVTMGVSDDPEVARAILTRHHAVLLGETHPGVSIIQGPLVDDRFEPDLLAHSAVPRMHACNALPQPLRWFMGRWAREMNATP